MRVFLPRVEREGMISAVIQFAVNPKIASSYPFELMLISDDYIFWGN